MVDVTTASSSLQFPETVAAGRRSKSSDPVAPIAVPPLEAARLLSCGLGHVYGLMNSGELDSFSSGRARRIPMQSIHNYMARQLAKADAKASDPAEPTPPRRRRGRRSVQGRK
jgi:excisionase family DNA binding protein